MTTNYNIISCDGGGIRGLMTAKLLDDLVTNPPAGYTNAILENVSLYVGTSTGGIIALGLASGLTPDTLVDLYKNSCGTIFTKYSSDELLYVEYTDTGLFNVLNTNLRNPDSQLSQLSSGVLVATFMMSDSNTDPWKPLALTNLPNSSYSSVTIIDAAMSSAAAPLYFPPHKVVLSNDVTMWCADGGLFANNPSTFALANILQSQILEQSELDLGNVRMLSLGTGLTIDAIVPSHLSNPYSWGILSWLNAFPVPPEPDYPLLNAMFDAQSQLADLEMTSLLGKNYLRANPILTKTIPLDDCAAIDTLMTIAENYISATCSSDSSPCWSDIKLWAYNNFI